MLDSPLCLYCDETETMGHMLFDWEHYSNLQWTLFGSVSSRKSAEDLPRPLPTSKFPSTPLFLTKKFLPYPFISHLKISGKWYRYSPYSLTSPPLTRSLVLEFRRIAHLLSVIRNLSSYLACISEKQWASSIEALSELSEIVTNTVGSKHSFPHLYPHPLTVLSSPSLFLSTPFVPPPPPIDK